MDKFLNKQIFYYIAAAGIFLIWLYSSLFSGKYLLADLFALLPQWGYLIVIGFFIFLAFKKKQNAIIKLFLIVGFILFLFNVDIVFQFKKIAPSNDKTIKILQWNILRWPSGKNEEAFLKYIKGIEADIYLFQEVWPYSFFKENEQKLLDLFQNYFVVKKDEFLTLRDILLLKVNWEIKF